MSAPVTLPVAPEVTARLIALATSWEGHARNLWTRIRLEDLDGAAAGYKACTASAHEKDARELRALSAELSGPVEGGQG